MAGGRASPRALGVLGCHREMGLAGVEAVLLDPAPCRSSQPGSPAGVAGRRGRGGRGRNGSALRARSLRSVQLRRSVAHRPRARARAAAARRPSSATGGPRRRHRRACTTSRSRPRRIAQAPPQRAASASRSPARRGGRRPVERALRGRDARASRARPARQGPQVVRRPRRAQAAPDRGDERAGRALDEAYRQTARGHGRRCRRR